LIVFGLPYICDNQDACQQIVIFRMFRTEANFVYLADRVSLLPLIKLQGDFLKNLGMKHAHLLDL
jgi:hypothetical protein